MNNYPDGIKSGYATHATQVCEACGCKWEAEAWSEMGEVEIENERDYQCPECGEIVE